ncbi:hypothetical protein [Agrobacterium arsenijevicii]|uniref:hypothetical protein n=1 Tax=Agrobacterium arsenijevicii TaxID=1585697 RepID=UPI001112293D
MTTAIDHDHLPREIGLFIRRQDENLAGDFLERGRDGEAQAWIFRPDEDGREPSAFRLGDWRCCPMRFGPISLISRSKTISG